MKMIRNLTKKIMNQDFKKYNVSYNSIKESYVKEINNCITVQDVKNLIGLILYNIGKTNKITEGACLICAE